MALEPARGDDTGKTCLWSQSHHMPFLSPNQQRQMLRTQNTNSIQEDHSLASAFLHTQTDLAPNGRDVTPFTPVVGMVVYTD